MYEERVFELIRQEEIVLWAGAGLSMYAGYPSANQLAEIIYNKLTATEKVVVRQNQPLSDLAEEYIRLKGGSRNALNKLLREIYDPKNAKSIAYHKLLSLVPHIKTIITTNYDNLFEQAYDSDCQTIINDNDVAYFNPKKVQIFKVHGDLSQPDSIIISKDDYTKFFDVERNKLLWSVVTERAATNSILIIGYGLEDPNVESLFKKIRSLLKENMKEIYLIAPDLPYHKVNDLSKDGVMYINSTGERFINLLIDNIKDNIVLDIKRGAVGVEAFGKFLDNFDLSAALQSGGNNYIVQSLKGKKGEANIEIKFKLIEQKPLIDELNN